MKLLNLLLADAVSPGAGNKFFIHGGGVSSLQASSFPYQHPRLGIFVTLVREDEEPGSDHGLSVSMIGPDGSTLEVLIEDNIRLPKDLDPESPVHLHLLGDFTGLVFQVDGLYWFSVAIDAEECGRVPLLVGAEGAEITELRRPG